MVRLSDVKEVIISPQGVERAIVHTLAINNELVNIAYELDSIILLGAPRRNTDYRPFNMDVRVAHFMFHKETKGEQTFNRARTKLFKSMNAEKTISAKGTSICNVAYKGIDFFLIYYLLCKHNPIVIELANNYEFLTEAFNMVDTILAPLKITAVNLRSFTRTVLEYQNVLHPIGSKAQTITRLQILHSADLTQPLWRTLYVHRILRNIPLPLRKHLFRPVFDSAFVRCATKYFFSSGELKRESEIGYNIEFLNETTERQARAMEQVAQKSAEMDKVNSIVSQLKLAVSKIDYALGDLALVTFFEDVGTTFDDEVEQTIGSSDKTLVSRMFTDHEQLKQVVLQYLYALFLLTQNGIIHNNASLHNVLLTPPDTSLQRRKRVYDLPNGKYVEMDPCLVNLTLIDFDKAILSRHHHDFSCSTEQIQKEVALALKDTSAKLVNDDNVVFNCYAMLDVVKFCSLVRGQLDAIGEEIRLSQRSVSTAANKKNRDWLDMVIKTASGILQKILISSNTEKLPFSPDETYGSMQWLVETLYPLHLKTSTSPDLGGFLAKPEFISSRRRRADTLKQQFLAQYASTKQ